MLKGLAQHDGMICGREFSRTSQGHFLKTAAAIVPEVVEKWFQPFTPERHELTLIELTTLRKALAGEGLEEIDQLFALSPECEFCDSHVRTGLAKYFKRSEKEFAFHQVPLDRTLLFQIAFVLLLEKQLGRSSEVTQETMDFLTDLQDCLLQNIFSHREETIEAPEILLESGVNISKERRFMRDISFAGHKVMSRLTDITDNCDLFVEICERLKSWSSIKPRLHRKLVHQWIPWEDKVPELKVRKGLPTMQCLWAIIQMHGDGRLRARMNLTHLAQFATFKDFFSSAAKVERRCLWDAIARALSEKTPTPKDNVFGTVYVHKPLPEIPVADSDTDDELACFTVSSSSDEDGRKTPTNFHNTQSQGVQPSSSVHEESSNLF